MKLIETTTLTSAQNQISLTSIPQTFTDLYLVVSARAALATFNGLIVWYNSYGTTFSERNLSGTGAAANSGTNQAGTGQLTLGFCNGTTTTANTFSSHGLYIPNYTSATTKSSNLDAVSENNATAANQIISAGLWSGTAAITSITVSVNGTGSSNGLAAGTIVSLYGITKGSDGITTAS